MAKEIGYRGEFCRKHFLGRGSEGAGLYVAPDYMFAARFGSKLLRICYQRPAKVLIADNLYVLTLNGKLFTKPTSSDSEWTRLEKQAAQEVKMQGFADPARIQAWSIKLRTLLLRAGYDAVQCSLHLQDLHDMPGSGPAWLVGTEWTVLLTPTVYSVDHVEHPKEWHRWPRYQRYL